MRRVQLFGLALLLASLLNCEDIKMANQRPVIGARAGAQDALDPNDVLYRNVELAKMRLTHPLEAGTIVSSVGTPRMVYKNTQRSPVLIALTMISSPLAFNGFYFGPREVANSGQMINIQGPITHYEILFPNEEIWSFPLAVAATIYGRYAVVSLNNLL